MLRADGIGAYVNPRKAEKPNDTYDTPIPKSFYFFDELNKPELTYKWFGHGYKGGIHELMQTLQVQLKRDPMMQDLKNNEIETIKNFIKTCGSEYMNRKTDEIRKAKRTPIKDTGYETCLGYWEAWKNLAHFMISGVETNKNIMHMSKQSREIFRDFLSRYCTVLCSQETEYNNIADGI